jgi:dTMP kinase
MPQISLFLSLDGIDGCGKSTQCRLLADWLRGRGHTVTECADPGGTELGRAIRHLLLESRTPMSLTCEMLLFMASRAQLVEEIIRPALNACNAVVSDRFLLANIVYQGYAGGLDPDLLWTIGLTSIGGRMPDLTLVLDLPPELALQRRKQTADRLESRGPDFQRRVREGFLTEAARHPDRIKVIDASPGVDAVHQAICQAVTEVLQMFPAAREG